MGERGPKPKTDLKVINKKILKYPRAEPGMTKSARTVWHRIVKSFPHDHFKPHQYDLLRAYCEASASHRRAILEMEENGEIVSTAAGGIKKSPWKDIEVQMNGSMTSLATKLGLSVNATIASKGIKGIAPKPKSKRGDLINRG